VTLPYRYRSQGRSALNLGVFAVAAGLLGLAVHRDAPVVVLLPMGLAAAGMACLVLFNPRAGLEIDREAVTLWQGARRRRIAIADISHAHAEHWSGRDDVTLHLTGGGKVDIPARCRPGLRPLAQAFAAAGIILTEI
jgi:hypothetical protein